MTAPKQTSVELCQPTQSNDTNKVKTIGERNDTHVRNPSQNDSGVFWWCEGWEVDINMLQDGVCGNAAVLLESRDDDTINDATKAITDGIESANSFIDSTIKSIAGSYSKDFEATKAKITETASRKDEDKSALEFDKTKVLVDSSSMSASNKAKYDRFMTLIENASKAYGSQSLPVADLYISLGIDLDDADEDDIKSKQLALVIYEEAFNIYQAKSGDSDVRTVDCRVRLGRTFLSLGRHDEALDSFCQAVYMREALLGELHPSVSDVWVFISSVHRAKGKLEPALKASAKALTGYRNAHGDKHPTVIAVLKTIATIHTEMGNDAKAADINKYVKIHSRAQC